METKELNDLKQSLKKQYFDSTGRDVDKHRSSLKMFIEHIRSDVQNIYMNNSPMIMTLIIFLM